MKAFYITALGIVLLLALSPFYCVPKQDTGRFDGLVVGYGAYASKIRSIDPATCGDVSSARVQGNFYEGLYTYHYLKRPVEVVPQLAAAMPDVSEDRLTYTIRIKPGIRYSRNACFGTGSDGMPQTRELRADDFALAMKRVADFHISSSLSWALIGDRIVGMVEYREKTRTFAAGDFSRYDMPIEGVRVVDPHTLEIRLTAQFPQLVYVLATSMFAPVPREVIDYHLATRSDETGGRLPIPIDARSSEIHNREAIVGTGPYVLTEWTRGSVMVLERNGEFREQFYPCEGAEGDREAGMLADAGKRVPFVDVWHKTFVAEANPAWMMFLTRQTDTAAIPPAVFDTVITPSRELTDQWEQRGVRLLKVSSSPIIYWYGFNLRDPVLGASKSLRQALCLAYDVEQEIDVLQNGRARRAVNMVPSSFEGHVEAGPSPYARFDLEAARAKMADARRELVAAGVIASGEDMPPITLDMGSKGDFSRKMAQFAQEQFRAIGITLNVELNDWPTLQEKVHNSQVQVYPMGWHADYPDPENFLQNFYSPNIEKGSNSTHYSNAEFDRLFAEASVMMPSPERTQLYAQAIRILSEDCPVALSTEPVQYGLINDWVSNYKPHPIGYGFGRFMRVDVDARRRAGGR